MAEQDPQPDKNVPQGGAPGSGAPQPEVQAPILKPAGGKEGKQAEKGKRPKKAKKKRGFVRTWFRTGLLGTLAVLAILCWAFYFFFLDGLVHWGIHRFGSQALGAKLEVESVRTSLFPPTLALTGVQAANPSKPMHNAVEAAEAVASFDLFALPSGRVLVEELKLTGLRLDTPRETSGALDPAEPVAKDEKEEPDEDKTAWDWLPDLESPDIEKILREEDLESVRLAEQTEADVKEAEERWKKRIEGLKARLSEREKEIKALRSAPPAERLRAATQLAAKIESVRKDIENLRTLRADLERDVAALRTRAEEIQQAVPKDAAHLKDKYATGPDALGNVAQAMFGPQAAVWANRAATAWPYVQALRERSKAKAAQPPPPVRSKGRFVSFADESAPVPAEPVLPRFVVGLVEFSAETDFGTISGTARDLTDMPSVLGRPATFQAAAEALDGLRSFSLQGVLDHVRPESPSDSIVASVRGLSMRDLALSGPARLAKGAADIDVDLGVLGNALDGTIRAAVSGAEFDLADDLKGEAAKAVGAALAGLKQFALSVAVGGTVERPEVGVRSEDLDNVLGNAMASFAGAQAERLEAELRQKIAAKVGERMGGIDERLGALTGFDGDLDALLKSARGLTGGAGAGGLLEGILGRKEAPQEPGAEREEQKQPPHRDPVSAILDVLGRAEAPQDPGEKDGAEEAAEEEEREQEEAPVRDVIRGIRGILGQ